jgi:hypothetical protein
MLPNFRGNEMAKDRLQPNNAALAARVTELYIYGMLVLFPLFTGFEGYAAVTLSKYVFFAAATLFWLIFLAFCELRAHGRAGAGRLPFWGLFLPAYLTLCLVSAVLSPYGASIWFGEGRFDGLMTIALCVGIFLGVARYARPKPGYLYAAVAAVSLNSVIALLQILGYNPLHLFPGDYGYYDAGTKFSSTFLGTIGNADLFSAYLCLLLPLMAVYYLLAPKRPLVLLPAVLLNAFALFACGVSGGILALGVTLLLAAPFLIRSAGALRRALELLSLLALAAFLALALQTEPNGEGVTLRFAPSVYAGILAGLVLFACVLRLAVQKSSFGEKPLRRFFAGLSVAAVLAVLALIYFWPGETGTAYELSRVLHGELDDSFGSSRILIWRKTLELVPDRLLFGGGPGTLPLRVDVQFSRFVEETGKTLSTSVDNAHNDYLGILVNTGALALIAYLAAQLASLLAALKSMGRSLFAPCLACALLCYWVQAFFGLGLFLVSPLMWLLWGLLAAALRKEHQKSIEIVPAE